MNRLFLILVLVSIFGKSLTKESYECNVGYCKSIVENGECPTLEKTDDEHKLPILPPIMCNCCEYYLIKLDKGESCLKGTPSSPLPSSVCGDGLYCKTSNDSGSGICDTIQTECTKEQAEYDKKLKDGTLGLMEIRPECDRNGDYSAVWCIPGQICYCRNKKGERIFGTVLYSSLVKKDVTCDCARKVDVAQKLLYEFDDLTMNLMRCLPNGNYDPLQCLNNETCLCTEEKTGKPSSYDWSRKLVKVPDINNKTLSCFNPKIHVIGEFLKSCQKDYENAKIERKKLEEQGIIFLGNKLPRCQPDGMYDKIQVNDTSKFCASPDGEPLENFVISKTSSLANTMSCNCARTRFILQQNGHTDLPECCENGNYVSIQCRLDDCYCVDDNGNQIAKEVNKNNIKDLKCTDPCTKPKQE